MDEEDEKIELSGSTLAALQSFYDERNQQEERFQQLKAAAERKDGAPEQWSMEMFAEDWNASQFWYSDETAVALAEELLRDADQRTHIAVVSAPSVFVQIKNIISKRYRQGTDTATCAPTVCLLEFDRRFNVFPEFIFYDFQQPLQLNSELKGAFDRILCDPPFLSVDCQTKAAMTVRWLAQASRTDDHNSQAKVIVCTGETMSDTVTRLYRGLQKTSFKPRHAQDRLSNDFCCYAAYQSPSWSIAAVQKA